MGLARLLDSVFKPRGASLDEEKASRTAPLIAFASGGRPVWSPRDYAALAREGYLRNPVVYRAVRMVSEAAASVPLSLFAEAEELTEHPLLRLLARPNRGQSGPDFLETLFGHLLVAGNAYVERIYVSEDADALPAELHVLRPDRVKVVPGTSGWPEAFEYQVGGKSLRLSGLGDVPQVRQLTLFHPLSDHYGCAPIEAAQVSLDIHNAAAGWNKALLDNAARPSGALVYGAGEGANLSLDQFERLKAELEEGYQGARNAGRPLLLEGGLDWRPMGLTPKDMDFIEAKREAAREIALAFGVPPMLIGIPGDNTFANYQEANRAFWRQTVLPLVRRTVLSLSNWLAPAYGAPLRLEPDADAIEALSPEREVLWRRVGAADFLSEDEKRAAVGYGRRAGSEETAGQGDAAGQGNV